MDYNNRKFRFALRIRIIYVTQKYNYVFFSALIFLGGVLNTNLDYGMKIINDTRYESS
jgi:hypothetical protein